MINFLKPDLKKTKTMKFNEFDGTNIIVHNLSIDFDYRQKIVKGTAYIFRTDNYGGINPFNRLLDSEYKRKRAYISLAEIQESAIGMEIIDDKAYGISGFWSVQNVNYFFGSVSKFYKFQKEQKVQYCKGNISTPSVEVYKYHPDSGSGSSKSDYYLITSKVRKQKVMPGIVHFNRGAHLAQMFERGEYALLKETMQGHNEWNKIESHYIVEEPTIIQRNDVTLDKWMRLLDKAKKDKEVIEHIKAFKKKRKKKWFERLKKS